MTGTVIYAVYVFSNILVMALLARAILSWFVRDMNGFLGGIYATLIKFTEPLVLPFRNLLSRFNTGMFDFSIVLAMLAVEICSNILIRLILFIF